MFPLYLLSNPLAWLGVTEPFNYTALEQEVVISEPEALNPSPVLCIQLLDGVYLL